MKAKPVVLFVDDEPSVLDGIRRAHGWRFDLRLADSGAKGLTLLGSEPGIAVVVSDVAMPRMDGATFLARVRLMAPNAVRLLLTGTSDIEQAARAVNDGRIFHFLTKPCPAESLEIALNLAVELHHELLADASTGASTATSHETPLEPAAPEALPSLSPREEEVLRLIAKGLRISDVAPLLDITTNTVCAHIKNIYRKRQLGSRAEAALEARRLGLV